MSLISAHDVTDARVVVLTSIDVLHHLLAAPRSEVIDEPFRGVLRVAIPERIEYREHAALRDFRRAV
jgi:hypothetical protein